MSATETPAVDKSSWGEGPWQHEPDRKEWIHAGFACLVTRHPSFGHLCGYVGVPREHPAYGKSYNGIDVDVHGGLTYTDKCRDLICHTPAAGMPDDVWWCGFDCSHAFDLSPGLEYRTRKMIAEAPPALQAKLRGPELPESMRGVYRTIECVERETNQLADQLAAMSV